MAQPQPPATLPPGFRFCPSDSELVLHYLRRRALGWPLPSVFIPDVDLLRHNPWDLLLPASEERYLFNYNKAKYGNSGGTNRATPGGRWKVTGRDKPVATAGGAVVGMRRTLVFYRKKPTERTDWIMHEYRLAGACLGAGSSQNAATSLPPAEGWVLCHIFRKKRGSPSNAEGGEAQHEAENVGMSASHSSTSSGQPVQSSPSSFVPDAASAPCTDEETTK